MNPFQGLNPIVIDEMLRESDLWNKDFVFPLAQNTKPVLNGQLPSSNYVSASAISLGYPEDFDDEAEHVTRFNATVICTYDTYEQNKAAEDPVVRIEVLSPSVLPGGHILEFGTQWPVYRDKREKILKHGTVLVEINVIPCCLPVTEGIPRYPHNAEAKTFHATISAGPSSEYPEGRFWHYQWGVDEPLPTLIIPLLGTDVVPLNLQKAYESITVSLEQFVPYDKLSLPRLWECYRADDQDRIAARLMTYLTHLDNGTLPADSTQPPALIADYTAPGIRNELEGFLKKRLERRS